MSNLRESLRLIRPWARLTAGLILILFAAGCGEKAVTPPSPLDSEYRKWKEMAETNQARSQALPAPAASKPDTLPPIQPQPKARTCQKPFPTQKVSLRMHNASVPAVLRALARAAGQNIMLSESVKGEISINVENTPWSQVFTGILATHGLGWKWENDIIRVVSAQDKENELRQLETDLKMQAARRDLQTLEPMVTRIVPLRYYSFTRRKITDQDTSGDSKKRTIEEEREPDIDKTFKENLEALLSRNQEGEPIGNILFDEQTNSVLVHALAHDAEKILALIRELDSPPPQILIEAHIVETTREVARELGIQWGGLYRAGNYWITPGSNTSGVFDKTLSEGVDPTTGISNNFPADFGPDDFPSGFTLGYLYEKFGKYVLDVELSALETDGKLNILSRPSITTMDNQPAVIESGAEVPYQSITGTGLDKDISIEWKTAALRLLVTPRVIEGDTIRLNIVTTKDELDFTRTVLGNPTILTKRAETNLILESGQTTVIGGLSKQTDQDTSDGIPYLQNIKGLTWLFGHTGKQNKMEDVLIFITPRILPVRPSLSAAAAPPSGSIPSGEAQARSK